MRRVVKGVAALAGVVILALAVGFVAFVVAVQTPSAPAPTVDGIVALTGGADRVETALRLLDSGKGRMLLVSGVAHGAGLNDMAARAGLDPAAVASRVTLGRVATTTFGNAQEAAEWAHDHAFHSLLLVTAGYHMPRAMLEMRRALPEVTIVPFAVQPADAALLRTLRLLLTEYGKLLAAWLGLSTMITHQVAVVQRPVHNPVSG